MIIGCMNFENIFGGWNVCVEVCVFVCLERNIVVAPQMVGAELGSWCT